jgi:hypothetical protein
MSAPITITEIETLEVKATDASDSSKCLAAKPFPFTWPACQVQCQRTVGHRGSHVWLWRWTD